MSKTRDQRENTLCIGIQFALLARYNKAGIHRLSEANDSRKKIKLINMVISMISNNTRSYFPPLTRSIKHHFKEKK